MTICLLHSEGPHSRKAVAVLRAAYPGADIAVVVRSAQEASAYIALPGPLALDSPGPGIRRGFAGTVRALRKRRADAFVVLFPSFRLRLIAVCSGARVVLWCGPDGRLRPIRQSLAALLAEEAAHRIRGWAVWVSRRIALMLAPVRPNGAKR